MSDIIVKAMQICLQTQARVVLEDFLEDTPKPRCRRRAEWRAPKPWENPGAEGAEWGGVWGGSLGSVVSSRWGPGGTSTENAF